MFVSILTLKYPFHFLEIMRRKLTIALAIIGLLVAVYLTFGHYSPESVICIEADASSCSSVLHGEYSVIFGVPVSILGFMIYAVIIALAYGRSIWLNRLLILAVFGVGYFNGIMLSIRQFCFYCEVSHVLMSVLYLINADKKLNSYLLFVLALILGLSFGVIVT